MIPDDIARVIEAELRAGLTTYLDCVAFAEDELVVRQARPARQCPVSPSVAMYQTRAYLVQLRAR